MTTPIVLTDWPADIMRSFLHGRYSNWLAVSLPGREASPASRSVKDIPMPSTGVEQRGMFCAAGGRGMDFDSSCGARDDLIEELEVEQLVLSRLALSPTSRLAISACASVKVQ